MDVKGSLLNSIDEILDKMAFMFFEELGEDPPAADEFKFITQVEMKGVIKGKLNILLTESTAKHIARNLIGIRDDDELYDDTLGDAMLEFTNLVAGRTMTILNPQGPFDMEVPHMVTQSASPAADLISLTIDGALDDEPFRILLQYKE